MLFDNRNNECNHIGPCKSCEETSLNERGVCNNCSYENHDDDDTGESGYWSYDDDDDDDDDDTGESERLS